MKRSIRFLKTTAIGGLLIIVPISAILDAVSQCGVDAHQRYEKR